MSSRAHYLVSYDIRDPKRWRKIHEIALDHGVPMQYSVFLCTLGTADLASLKAKMADEIHHDEDQLLFACLGPETSEEKLKTRMEWMGKPYEKLDTDRLVF